MFEGLCYVKLTQLSINFFRCERTTVERLLRYATIVFICLYPILGLGFVVQIFLFSTLNPNRDCHATDADMS